MGRSVVTFGSIPKSNFLRIFDVFLDFVILPYFNAISIDFYAVKCGGWGGGGVGGGPSSKNFFFRPEGYSNKPNS